MASESDGEAAGPEIGECPSENDESKQVAVLWTTGAFEIVVLSRSSLPPISIQNPSPLTILTLERRHCSGHPDATSALNISVPNEPVYS